MLGSWQAVNGRKKRLRTPTLEETLITKEFARFDNNDSEPKSQVRLL